MTLKWVEMKIHTSTEAIDPISNILHEAGLGGLVIEDKLDVTSEKPSVFGEIYDINMDRYPVDGVYIKAYLPVTSQLDEKVQNIERAINHLETHQINLGENKVWLHEIDEEDWTTSWKKYYKPVKISETITIAPTWENYEPRKNELIIELDPGMAFGTGTHPTTALSILALEKYLSEGDSIVDVGSGSGVLSIASVKLGAKSVYAFDLDEIAVKSTTLNTELNQVSDRVQVKQNDLLDEVSLQANIVVSNILAEIIVRFVQDAWNNLVDGGLFVTSGIIEKKQADVKQELMNVGFKIIEVTKRENWICIVAKK